MKISTDTVIAGVGLLISLIALLISYFSYKSADNQFNLLNQGYLIGTIYTGLTSQNVTANATLDSFSNESEFQGIVFTIDLENVGNLPIKYNISQFDILFNNIKVEQTTNYLLPRGFYIQNKS